VERLYIPEPFSVDKKAEIAQRRMARLAKAATPVNSTRQLMIVIGEIAEIRKTPRGFAVRFKHVVDCDFQMNEDMHSRLSKRFSNELELWKANGDDGVHLMAIATVGVSQSGVPSFEEIALMAVTQGWVPFENQFEASLLKMLTDKRRRFVKGLRYNLSSTASLASVVLTDTHPQPTAMYIVPIGASDEQLEQMGELIEHSKLPSWQWDPSGDEMPALPGAAAASTLHMKQAPMKLATS
jgi:hypothetical protein